MRAGEDAIALTVPTPRKAARKAQRVPNPAATVLACAPMPPPTNESALVDRLARALPPRLSPVAATPVQKCLAEGGGDWAARDEVRDPWYTLPPDYLPGFNGSYFWWGRCDHFLRPNGLFHSYPQRVKKHRWHPKGPGCEHLPPPKRLNFPPLSQAFCDAFAGKRLLFVGDSVQAEFFTSFVNNFGLVRARQEPRAREGWICHEGNDYFRDVRNPHELDMVAELCPVAGGGTGRVVARYLRNEHILIDKPDESQRRRDRTRRMCDLRSEHVRWADVVVVNRGPHYVPDSYFARELAETLHTLRRVPPRVPGGPPRRLVYRGTHAPVPKCSPIRPISTRSLAYQVLWRKGSYHWQDFAHQNSIARCLAGAFGVTYLDTYYQMSFRTDAGLRWDDCMHSCLPGPVDEWSRLLAVLLLDGVSDGGAPRGEGLSIDALQQVQGQTAAALTPSSFSSDAVTHHHQRPGL